MYFNHCSNYMVFVCLSLLNLSLSKVKTASLHTDPKNLEEGLQHEYSYLINIEIFG